MNPFLCGNELDAHINDKLRSLAPAYPIEGKPIDHQREIRLSSVVGERIFVVHDRIDDRSRDGINAQLDRLIRELENEIAVASK